jgi:hypothetical protein
MVRNLVLTPFIDLAFAHFMFSCEKVTEFFRPRDFAGNRSTILTAGIIFSLCAPISLLMGITEGNAHD